jgi:hypothetical protein
MVGASLANVGWIGLQTRPRHSLGGRLTTERKDLMICMTISGTTTSKTLSSNLHGTSPSTHSLPPCLLLSPETLTLPRNLRQTSPLGTPAKGNGQSQHSAMHAAHETTSPYSVPRRRRLWGVVETYSSGGKARTGSSRVHPQAKMASVTLSIFLVAADPESAIEEFTFAPSAARPPTPPLLVRLKHPRNDHSPASRQAPSWIGSFLSWVNHSYHIFLEFQTCGCHYN